MNESAFAEENGKNFYYLGEPSDIVSSGFPKSHGLALAIMLYWRLKQNYVLSQNKQHKNEKKGIKIGYVIIPHLYAKFTPSDQTFIRWSTTAELSNRHSSCRAVSSSIRVAGGGKREDTARPRASQRFSIGLGWGEYAGHAIRAIPSLSR
ncbi:UNVERIFIED_CONTAM: hypothetical protein NCL1_21386 [Trichonephila clavipes]